jgi:hypothetical protein
MYSKCRKFGLSMLVAVMTLVFSAPGLASVVNSFYQAEPSKSFVELFDLHVNDVEDFLFTSNHFDDTESFLFRLSDLDSYAEIESIQLLPRITSVVTFEKETSVKDYNQVTKFELLNNEVGWANYLF